MILAKNINKTFGDLQILKGIDLEIKKSEIVSIIGKSGAGKTTLLQILGTLSKPDKDSELLINNTQILSMSDRELSKFRNQNIGFIFQFHQLLPEFTALENICIPAYIAKKNKSETQKKALELLRFLDIKNRENHKPNKLSGGEQQRIAIARALINNPKVIFADEPTGNLDSKNANEIHNLFLKLREEFGQTFVIVTHNKELSEVSDRKILIQDGQIIL